MPGTRKSQHPPPRWLSRVTRCHGGRRKAARGREPRCPSSRGLPQPSTSTCMLWAPAADATPSTVGNNGVAVSDGFNKTKRDVSALHSSRPLRPPPTLACPARRTERHGPTFKASQVRASLHALDSTLWTTQSQGQHRGAQVQRWRMWVRQWARTSPGLSQMSRVGRSRAPRFGLGTVPLPPLHLPQAVPPSKTLLSFIHWAGPLLIIAVNHCSTLSYSPVAEEREGEKDEASQLAT